MSHTCTESTGLPPTAKKGIRANLNTFLDEFPSPPTEFTATDIDHVQGPTLAKLTRERVLILVHDDITNHARVYRVNDDAWQYATSTREEIGALPCGHVGYRNIGDGYTCGYEHCTARHTRACIEEVYDD